MYRFDSVMFLARAALSNLCLRSRFSTAVPLHLLMRTLPGTFMLITDACLLVMLAGAIGHPGEVMVLDMGEPVYIYDVAHEMRKAYERYDVDIVVTGLRPGEKIG